MPFSLVFKSNKKDLKLEISENNFSSGNNERLKEIIDSDQFSIQEEDRGFSFKADSGDFTLDEGKIQNGHSSFLPSGRELHSPSYTIIASVISDRAEIAKSEDFKSVIARTTIGLILLCEILFISVLPNQLDGKESFKREYLLEGVSENLDNLRKDTSNQLEGSAAQSSIKTGILNDIKDALDEIAINLRLHPDQYSTKDLQNTKQTLSKCHLLLKKVKHTDLIDQNSGIDKQALLNQTFAR